MASTKKAASKKKKDEEHAQATGFPPSPTEDLTDHSTSASAIAAAIDPKGESGATVNAESMDKLNEQAEAKEEADRAEEDNSLMGRIRKSELFFVHDHNTEERYVGISPQNDPNASSASRRLSTVTSLDSIAPQTGMVIKPKDGAPFSVPDGYGPDAKPTDWAAITNPETKKPLFG